MENIELIDNLEKDLAEINAPKSAHIKIAQILNAYKQHVSSEKKEEPKNKKGKDSK